MRIVWIDTDFAALAGHTGTRTFEMSRQLAAGGHEVEVVCSDRRLPELLPSGFRSFHRSEVDGVRVTIVNAGLGRIREGRLGWLRQLAFTLLACGYLLRVRRPDVVCVTVPSPGGLLPALAAWWLRRVPFVLEVRRLVVESLVGTGRIRSPVLIGAVTALIRCAYRGAARIVALTDPVARHIGADSAFRGKIVLVPHCCDLALFGAGDGRRLRADNEWEDRFICLHLGSMSRVNGLEAILRAADVLREDPKFLFWLVGDGEHRDQIERNIRDRGLHNVVIWDPQPRTRLPDILAAADLCLMTVRPYPVLEQASGTRLFDYLAAGRPVLLNYGGWQRDLLESHGAGLGTGLGRHEEFWQRLCELCDDPDRRAEMGRNARRLAEKQFDQQRWAAVFEEVLAAACASGSPLGGRGTGPREARDV